MAWAPPIIATAGDSRPLSGPTKNPDSVAAAIARRAVPTPGSTTASTTPGRKILDRPGQGQGAGPDIARRNPVSDVDDP